MGWPGLTLYWLRWLASEANKGANLASEGKMRGLGKALGKLAMHDNLLGSACSAPGVSVILSDRRGLVGRKVLVREARGD